MRYPVHKKMHEIEQTKSRKVLECIVKVWIELPALLAFGIFMLVGEIWPGLLMLLVGTCLAVGVHLTTALPETSGYVELGEDIVFHNVMGKYRHRRYQYGDIRYICIDDCPAQFRKNKSKNSCYTGEEWRSIYGKYVIAISRDNDIMFACSYTDGVWNFLAEQCSDTAEKNFTEKEWLEYKQAQIELQKKTENDNGYRKIISQFDGYVN